MEQAKLAQIPSQAGSGHRTLILIITSLSTISVSFMSSAFTVALPVIGREFGTDAVLLSWIVTVYVLAYAIFLVPLGRIADIVGLKKVLFSGVLLYTVTCAAAIFSNSTMMLIALRCLQGIGAAMIAGTSTAVVAAMYPPAERGRALGINIAFVYTGTSLGPILGGIITEHWGWWTIFTVNAIFSALVLVLLLWKVKGEWRESKGEKFDYIGSLVYGFGLVVLMYGFSLLPEAQGIILVVVGVVGLFIFVRWENRIANPILNINLFRRNIAFTLANLSMLIHYSAIFALSFLLILYLQYVKGLSPDYAGLLLIAQPVLQAIFSPFAGRLSDKIEPRFVAATGMALTCAGLAFFIFLAEATPLVVIPICLAAIGVGHALYTAPVTNSMMSSVEPKYYGLTAAIMSTMRTVGQTLSMGITTIIFAMVIGRVVITPEYHVALLDSIQIAFVIFTILCFGSIFALLVKNNPKQTPPV